MFLGWILVNLSFWIQDGLSEARDPAASLPRIWRSRESVMLHEFMDFGLEQHQDRNILRGQFKSC